MVVPLIRENGFIFDVSETHLKGTKVVFNDFYVDIRTKYSHVNGILGTAGLKKTY